MRPGRFRVACGSTSPAKVAAARALVGRLGWPAEVLACEVGSGVRPQPVGEGETRRGATNRARRALAAERADIGLGCEAGIAWRGRSAWLVNWAVAVDRAGRRGSGRGLSLQLPPAAATVLRAGGSLGDWVRGAGGAPAAEGAIGLLTGRLVSRQALWEQALAAALALWTRPELYGDGDR